MIDCSLIYTFQSDNVVARDNPVAENKYFRNEDPRSFANFRQVRSRLAATRLPLAQERFLAVRGEGEEGEGREEEEPPSTRVIADTEGS